MQFFAAVHEPWMGSRLAFPTVLINCIVPSVTKNRAAAPAPKVPDEEIEGAGLFRASYRWSYLVWNQRNRLAKNLSGAPV